MRSSGLLLPTKDFVPRFAVVKYRHLTVPGCCTVAYAQQLNAVVTTEIRLRFDCFSKVIKFTATLPASRSHADLFIEFRSYKSRGLVVT